MQHYATHRQYHHCALGHDESNDTALTPLVGRQPHIAALTAENEASVIVYLHALPLVHGDAGNKMDSQLPIGTNLTSIPRNSPADNLVVTTHLFRADVATHRRRSWYLSHMWLRYLSGTLQCWLSPQVFLAVSVGWIA